MIYKSNFTMRLFCMVFLAFFVTVSSVAQNVRRVTGTVTDDKGETLIGATVKERTHGAGTVTDLDGRFSLDVDGRVSELQISYVGYKTKTVKISSGGPLAVTLESDEHILQEAVVIGYGVQRKSDLTGSVSSVNSKDFNQGVVNSPEALVNGKVSGVQIISSGGSPSAGSTIRIRGGASLNAANDPLIVLDGMPMEVGGSVSGSGNFLSLINPNDIESMTILKDASSTAIYGSRASNGVIIITTKKGTSSVRPKITFSSTNALQSPTRTADMITREELYRLVRTYGNDSQKSLLNDGVDTDWNKEIFHTAFGTDNNLGISGRAGAIPYRLSFGVSGQNGILRTDNVTRYTGSITLTPMLLDNRLKLNINLKGTCSDNRFANTEAIWSSATHNPCSPVYSGSDAFLGY